MSPTGRTPATTREEATHKAKLCAVKPAQPANPANETAGVFHFQLSPPSSLLRTSKIVSPGPHRASQIGRIHFLRTTLIEELDEDDREAVFCVIDSMLTKKKMRRFLESELASAG